MAVGEAVWLVLPVREGLGEVESVGDALTVLDGELEGEPVIVPLRVPDVVGLAEAVKVVVLEGQCEGVPLTVVLGLGEDEGH